MEKVRQIRWFYNRILKYGSGQKGRGKAFSGGIRWVLSSRLI
jgi:hypothetical protein